MLPLASGLRTAAVVAGVARGGAVVRGGRVEVAFVAVETGGGRAVLTVDVSDAADDALDCRAAATVDSGDLRGVPFVEGVATGRLNVLVELPDASGFGRVVVAVGGLAVAVAVTPRGAVEGLVEVEVLSGLGRVDVLDPREEASGFFVGAAAVRGTVFFGAITSGVGASTISCATSNSASFSITA